MALEQPSSHYYRIEERVLPDSSEGLLPPPGGYVEIDTFSPILVGDKVYQNSYVAEYNGDLVEFYTQILNLSTMKWSRLALSNSAFEQDGRKYDGVNSDIYPSLSENAYTSVYRLEEGNSLAKLDASGVMVLCDFSKDMESDYSDRFVSDLDGAFYQICRKSQTILCYDKCLAKRKTVNTTSVVNGILQQAEGMPVYWYGLDNDKKAIVQCFEKEEYLLRDFEGVGSDYYAMLTRDGVLYLADTQNVWRMEGERLEKVYSFTQNGYLLKEIYGMLEGPYHCPRFLVLLDGDLVLLDMEEIEALPEKQEVVIAFAGRPFALENSVARFNRLSSQYHISIMLPENQETADQYRSRIMMELAAGRGPDILGHDLMDDLASFVRCGYLQPVDDVIERTEGYIQAIFKEHQVNGVKYGIPYDCSFEVAAYNGDWLPEGNCISLSRLILAVEEAQTKVIEEGDAVQVLLDCVLYDEENSSFIDWCNGNSHLNEAAFTDLLQFVKDHSVNNTEQEKAFMYTNRLPFSSLSQIKEIFSYFDGRAKLLGYPRQRGNGFYVNSRALYLCTNAECSEGAKEFMRYLISDEEQKKYAVFQMEEVFTEGVGSVSGHNVQFPISKIAIDTLIADELKRDQKNLIYTDNGPFQVGSMYTEEMIQAFRFMIENVRTDNPNVTDVVPIFYEELTPYFSGDVAKEVAAEKLHNRVQLYLNERDYRLE